MFIYIITGVLVVGIATMLLDRTFYRITVEDEVHGSIEDVWRILALEYGNIHKYSEHVSSVEIVEGDGTGLGCIRKCTLTDGGFMQEEIVAWNENEELEIEIRDSSMPMVPGTSVHFALRPTVSGVKVTATGKYRLKFMGPLSPLVAERKYKELITHLIDVLKRSI